MQVTILVSYSLCRLCIDTSENIFLLIMIGLKIYSSEVVDVLVLNRECVANN